MSGLGKASAKIAVGELGVLRGTNIGRGLRVGAQVLAGRWTSGSVGTKSYAALVASEQPARADPHIRLRHDHAAAADVSIGSQ
jgi:hypothetical protein